MPRRRGVLFKRSSLPTILEEPTPTPVMSRSLPGRLTHHDMSTPIPIPTRNSSSLSIASTEDWSISTRSYMNFETNEIHNNNNVNNHNNDTNGNSSNNYCMDDDDECAILDDSDDEEEFGPPNSRDPLTFPRSPPKPIHSPSILGILLANLVAAKRSRPPTTPRRGSSRQDSDYESDDVLEMRPRGRRIRRRGNDIPRAGVQDFSIPTSPLEQADPDSVESTIIVNEETVGEINDENEEGGTANVDASNHDVRNDRGFWDDFFDNHGGFNAHGW